jgi:hypothetical protein
MLATATFFAGIRFERERRRRQDLEEGSNDATMFPRRIQTVRVRIAGTASFANRIDGRLAEAVEQRIETMSPYKVVTRDSESDSELSITVADKSASQSSSEDNTASITTKWVDKQGSMLRPSFTRRLDDSLDERAINRMAQQIVGQMEATW